MAIDLDDVDDVRDGHTPEIRTPLDRWIAVSGHFFAWAIFVAFAVSVYEVIARYAFGKPTIWAHESTTFLIAVIFLVAGPIALARDKHIRVRVIYDAVTPRVRRWLDVLNSCIALVFLSGLTYAGWTMTWKATHTPTGDLYFQTTGTAWNPPTPALIKIAILLCAGIMLVQTVLHLIEALRRRPAADTARKER